VHGCESRHIETIHVLETFQGQTVWDGQVQVFDLCEPYVGRKCFAWDCIDERPRKQRRYVTVLEAPNVRSAAEAVRASLTSDARTWPKDRKSTRLNSSHEWISYAVFCLKKKK